MSRTIRETYSNYRKYFTKRFNRFASKQLKYCTRRNYRKHLRERMSKLRINPEEAYSLSFQPYRYFDDIWKYF